MLLGGLVSITFRQLTPEEIIELVREARLDAIEWGGDVHVPHGDTRTAREIRAQTEAAGLRIPMYGSYYRLGVAEESGLSFGHVLETALELGAPSIRVWAGERGSGDADEAYRSRATNDAIRIAEMACDAGCSIAYEYHGGTLTDTTESAARLLADTDHPAVHTIWQPPNGWHEEQATEGLNTVRDRVSHLHVFAWDRENGKNLRRPLVAHRERWGRYLKPFGAGPEKTFAMLEFVADDHPATFLQDADTLRALLRDANSD